MDTRLLKYFLAIVEAGSISRAAAQLHMTQPPLSAALAQLEKDLGVSLVVRTGRGVVPTPAGLVLNRYAHELLDSMDDVRERVKRIAMGLVGELRLSVVAPFLWGPLPELLRRLVAVAPDVDVSVSAPAPLEVLETVRHGRADLGVVSVSKVDELAERFGSELHLARAGTYGLVANLPARFAGSTDPFDLTVLNEETWIMVRSTLGVASLPEVVRDVWRNHGILPARERTVESVTTGLALVAADLGVSLAPDPLRSISPAGILTRRPAQNLPRLEFAVVWSRKNDLSASAQRFLSLAIQ